MTNFGMFYGCRTEKWEGTKAIYLLFSNEDIVIKIKLYFIIYQRTCVKLSFNSLLRKLGK